MLDIQSSVRVKFRAWPRIVGLIVGHMFHILDSLAINNDAIVWCLLNCMNWNFAVMCNAAKQLPNSLAKLPVLCWFDRVHSTSSVHYWAVGLKFTILLASCYGQYMY